MSLLSQVMSCGDADCAAPCYALIAFPLLITMLEASCTTGSTPCYNGYSAAFNSIFPVAYSCSVSSGYTACSSVGIYTRFQSASTLGPVAISLAPSRQHFPWVSLLVNGVDRGFDQLHRLRYCVFLFKQLYSQLHLFRWMLIYS